jgi:hypothetical protein
MRMSNDTGGYVMDWNRVEKTWNRQKAKSKRSGTILPTTIWTESPAIANSSREFQESYSISKDQVRKDIDDWLNSQA